MFKKGIKSAAGAVLLTGAFILTQPFSAYAADTVTSFTDFSKAVTTHMTNRDTSFEIDYSGTSSDVASLTMNLESLIKDGYSADDYLKWSWTDILSSGMIYSYSTADRAVININVTYLTTKAQEEFSDGALQQAVNSLIKDGMTNKAKITAIHDWVLGKFAYDKSLQNRSVYEGLTEGTFVCQGYALTMYRMLKAAGFEARIVDGSMPAGPHAWNMVNLDGRWYFIDATNDDAGSNKYRLFLVGSNVLHLKKYKWDQSNYPVASTKSYIQIQR